MALRWAGPLQIRAGTIPGDRRADERREGPRSSLRALQYGFAARSVCLAPQFPARREEWPAGRLRSGFCILFSHLRTAHKTSQFPMTDEPEGRGGAVQAAAASPRWIAANSFSRAPPRRRAVAHGVRRRVRQTLQLLVRRQQVRRPVAPLPPPLRVPLLAGAPARPVRGQVRHQHLPAAPVPAFREPPPS